MLRSDIFSMSAILVSLEPGIVRSPSCVLTESTMRSCPSEQIMSQSFESLDEKRHRNIERSSDILTAYDSIAKEGWSASVLSHEPSLEYLYMYVVFDAAKPNLVRDKFCSMLIEIFLDVLVCGRYFVDIKTILDIGRAPLSSIGCRSSQSL
ncbi:hypothetical protein Tco_0511541 [Tanacetum coccineum]